MKTANTTVVWFLVIASFLAGCIVTTSSYEEKLDKSKLIDTPAEPDIVMTYLDRTCEGFNIRNVDMGNPPRVWFCSDGEIIYDETGMKLPTATGED